MPPRTHLPRIPPPPSPHPPDHALKRHPRRFAPLTLRIAAHSCTKWCAVYAYASEARFSDAWRRAPCRLRPRRTRAFANDGFAAGSWSSAPRRRGASRASCSRRLRARVARRRPRFARGRAAPHAAFDDLRLRPPRRPAGSQARTTLGVPARRARRRAAHCATLSGRLAGNTTSCIAATPGCKTNPQAVPQGGTLRRLRPAAPPARLTKATRLQDS